MTTEQTIERLARKHFGTTADSITPLGGGFYGRVFLAETGGDPSRVVYKAYLFPGIARKEAAQLKALAEHALAAMPRVYFVAEGEGGEPDVMAMEYIDGVNLGLLESLPEASGGAVASEAVDNLLAFHSAVNPKGFGPLDASEFAADWRDYYRTAAQKTVAKAQRLHETGQLGRGVLDTVRQAAELFDRVFYLPVTQACLIHGDYNTWNILVSGDLCHVRAVIDPFNCCWADPEFDLYQLDNANGKQLGLLDLYRKKRGLSENFPVKRAFYELFTELNHYYDAQVGTEGSRLPEQALALRGCLDRL